MCRQKDMFGLLQILKFYEAMGKMMGDKLAKEGGAGQTPPGAAGQGPSGRR